MSLNYQRLPLFQELPAAVRREVERSDSPRGRRMGTLLRTHAAPRDIGLHLLQGWKPQYEAVARKLLAEPDPPVVDLPDGTEPARTSLPPPAPREPLVVPEFVVPNLDAETERALAGKDPGRLRGAKEPTGTLTASLRAAAAKAKGEQGALLGPPWVAAAVRPFLQQEPGSPGRLPSAELPRLFEAVFQATRGIAGGRGTFHPHRLARWLLQNELVTGDPDELVRTHVEMACPERLRAVRVARGWSQDQLAAQITSLGGAFSGSRVGKIETGESWLWSEELVAAALVLDVPLSVLTGAEPLSAELSPLPIAPAAPRDRPAAPADQTSAAPEPLPEPQLPPRPSGRPWAGSGPARGPLSSQLRGLLAELERQEQVQAHQAEADHAALRTRAEAAEEQVRRQALLIDTQRETIRRLEDQLLGAAA